MKKRILAMMTTLMLGTGCALSADSTDSDSHRIPDRHHARVDVSLKHAALTVSDPNAIGKIADVLERHQDVKYTVTFDARNWTLADRRLADAFIAAYPAVEIVWLAGVTAKA